MRHRGDRNDDVRHAKLGAIAGAVDRARAAIGDEREITWIMAAADRHFPQCVGHLRVDDLPDPGRSLFG